MATACTPWYPFPMAVHLDEALDELRARLHAGARRIAIRAPLGSGKTTVLRGLAASLASTRRVVHVELPEGDDAALVAIVETAIQLGKRTPDLLSRVVSAHEPARVPWASRLAAVEEALRSVGDDLLILLDGPRFQPSGGVEGELFAQRAVDVTRALLDVSRGAVVLAGAWIPEGIADAARFSLPLVRDADVARVHDSTGMLSGVPRPYLPSPVAHQLGAALASAGAPQTREARLPPLVKELGRLLDNSLDTRRVLVRLAAIRVAFSDDLLDRAGYSALPPVSQRLVADLLEDLGGGSRRAPDALAREIRQLVQAGDPAWRTDEPATESHRFAAEYHRGRFEKARARGDVATAVRDELEEIHHLTEAGDAEALLGRSLQFVEQYDALGKSLSQRALHTPRDKGEQAERLRRDAVRAYDRAIAHEPRDAYAHHYVAYNLDILGVEPERVEREYVLARDIHPEHPWYHGRYICFLITTAWMAEARAAWNRALDDLAGAAGSPQQVLCERLHAQIAVHLLARGELDFAADVLEDVPHDLRDLPWWRALEHLRACLEEDRDEELVFPPALAMEERWLGPHLLADQDLAHVREWHPGRVIGRDARGVVLRVARRRPDLSAGTPASRADLWTATLDVSELRETWNAPIQSLAAGTFVELIEYEGGTKVLKTWDRRSSDFDAVPGLPKLFPYPDRYVRRAFA